MEKDKYYVPEISEFYIGFEYELLVPNKIGKDAIESWKTQQVTPYFFHDIIKGGFITLIKEGKIRVKYLDKKDMESIKFFYGRDLPDKGLEDYKEFYYLPSINLSKTYDVILVTNYKETLIYKNLNLIFRGKLKNLSELKVLLKQLNIL